MILRLFVDLLRRRFLRYSIRIYRYVPAFFLYVAVSLLRLFFTYAVLDWFFAPLAFNAAFWFAAARVRAVCQRAVLLVAAPARLLAFVLVGAGCAIIFMVCSSCCLILLPLRFINGFVHDWRMVSVRVYARADTLTFFFHA